MKQQKGSKLIKQGIVLDSNMNKVSPKRYYIVDVNRQGLVCAVLVQS